MKTFKVSLTERSIRRVATPEPGTQHAAERIIVTVEAWSNSEACYKAEMQLKDNYQATHAREVSA